MLDILPIFKASLHGCQSTATKPCWTTGSHSRRDEERNACLASRLQQVSEWTICFAQAGVAGAGSVFRTSGVVVLLSSIAANRVAFNSFSYAPPRCAEQGPD